MRKDVLFTFSGFSALRFNDFGVTVAFFSGSGVAELDLICVISY